MQIITFTAHYKIGFMGRLLLLVLVSLAINLSIKYTLFSLLFILGANFVWLVLLVVVSVVPYTISIFPDKTFTINGDKFKIKLTTNKEIEVIANKHISNSFLFISFVINCLFTIINAVIAYFF